jgi:serine/threonine-protein kinase RsbT
MADEVSIAIDTDADLVAARAGARSLAIELGFSRTDATLIATAISEIARNMVVHVGKGKIVMRPLYEGRRYGLVMVASDDGPGIRDIDAALAKGNTGRGGLGLGLPGARRLMDEFEVECGRNGGTTVTMTKWRTRDQLELLREKRRADG